MINSSSGPGVIDKGLHNGCYPPARVFPAGVRLGFCQARLLPSRPGIVGSADGVCTTSRDASADSKVLNGLFSMPGEVFVLSQ